MKNNCKTLLIKPRSVSAEDVSLALTQTLAFGKQSDFVVLGSCTDGEREVLIARMNSIQHFLFSPSFSLTVLRMMKLLVWLRATRFKQCIVLKSCDHEEKNLKGHLLMTLSNAKKKMKYDVTKGKLEEVGGKHPFAIFSKMNLFVFRTAEFFIKCVHFIVYVRKFRLNR